MRSGSVATVLSVVALAGLGVVYVKLDRLEDRIDAARAEPRREALPAPIPDRDRPAEAQPGREEPERSPAPAAGKDDDEAPLTRAELEDRLRTLEARSSKWRKRPRVGDVKQLSRMLELTKTQEDRITAVVDNGRQRVEEIMKIPDGSGTSPFERRLELQRMVGEAMRTGEWGEVLAAMKTPGARNRQIPGRNSTYGEEISRVVTETRDEIVRNLSPDQGKEFGDAPIEPLLNAGGLDPGEVVGRAKKDGPAPEADDG